MTFEQRVAELNADGWLVNNLFQLDGGQWRASIRRPGGEFCSAFAVGATSIEALERSLKTVIDEQPPRLAVQPVANALGAAGPATIEDLLG